MASLPAQVVYAPPPPSIPTGPSFGGHPPPHPNQHHQQSQSTSSNSSAYHPQHHSQHHSQHLPPPPPHAVHQQQHYQGYAQQYPAPHSSSHHHQQNAQYQQDREHPQERRLPSIRDLDFQFQQQQQQQQQSQQTQQPRQNASASAPSPSSANTGPNGNTGVGVSTGGSTVSPTALMITPARGGNSGGRRYWPPAGPSGSSHPPQGHHQQAPPPPPPHQQNQLYGQAQQPTPALSASSSFTTGPGPGLGGRFPAAQRQGPERAGMGGRASVGSVGSSGSMGGMNAGSTAGGSGGGHGGISSVSPVGRSPLVPHPPYAHSAGYAPPGVIGVGASSGVGPGGGVPGGGVNSVGASGSGNEGAPGGPQSPYGFPSPHTPHHRLHTPVSQHGHPQHQQHGQGTGGGGPPGSQQHYEYDYGYPAYAHPHGTGQGSEAGNDHHGYGGRGIPQGMYGAAPPPSQQPEAWNAHPHGVPYHQNLQQHQAQGYGRPPPPGPSSGSTLTGAMGGYGAPPPPPPHAQTQEHVMSPGLPDQDVAAGGGVASVGGMGVGVAGSSAGGLGDARNYYFPKIHQLCYMLYEFSRRYANAQAQPAQTELEEMTHNAAELVRLLSEYRRTAFGEGAAPVSDPAAIGSAGLPSPAPEEYGRQRGGGMPSSAGGMRALKRPWEDVAGESDEDGFGPPGQSASAPAGRRKDAALDMADSISARANLGGMVGTLGDLGAGEGKGMDRSRSAAEKDMALIRSKRASNAAGTSAGTPKGKYRKRSMGSEKRATPPGKCHSCNIRETPEWRRGPDGARTLCNACGLHYAKLVRKRDKAASNDKSQTRVEIDMDTLRASARAANEREQLKAEREKERERERAVASGKAGSNSQLPDSGGAMASPLATTLTTGLGLEVTGASGNGDGGLGMNGMGVAGDGWRSYAIEQTSFSHEAPASAVGVGRPVSS